jgi:hypothetical protein
MRELFVEPLESRRLLSAALLTPGISSGSIAGLLPSLTASSTILVGTTINAEANQAFRAVIGNIRGLRPLPSGYSLDGDINWGDGTAHSAAQFVRQADGSVAVLGAHTYSDVGSDAIKVIVTAVPPPGSDALVRLVGAFNSKANVIASNGGVTLEETAGVAFTATVGFFSSNRSSLTMTAIIQWGDGTQSQGKILALPTAGLIPRFAVMGSHTYAKTGSYLAHVTVYSTEPPSPIVAPTDPTSPTTTPPIYLVAQIDSVIDVLPPEPTAIA